jgi:hypothetical protein
VMRQDLRQPRQERHHARRSGPRVPHRLDRTSRLARGPRQLRRRRTQIARRRSSSVALQTRSNTAGARRGVRITRVDAVSARTGARAVVRVSGSTTSRLHSLHPTRDNRVVRMRADSGCWSSRGGSVASNPDGGSLSRMGCWHVEGGWRAGRRGGGRIDQPTRAWRIPMESDAAFRRDHVPRAPPHRPQRHYGLTRTNGDSAAGPAGPGPRASALLARIDPPARSETDCAPT